MRTYLHNSWNGLLWPRPVSWLPDRCSPRLPRLTSSGAAACGGRLSRSQWRVHAPAFHRLPEHRGCVQTIRVPRLPAKRPAPILWVLTSAPGGRSLRPSLRPSLPVPARDSQQPALSGQRVHRASQVTGLRSTRGQRGDVRPQPQAGGRRTRRALYDRLSLHPDRPTNGSTGGHRVDRQLDLDRAVAVGTRA